MINYPTIAKYLAKLFSKYFIITSFVIICVIFVASAFDILQKFKSIHISSGDFWRLIVFKIPYLFSETSSLIGFIATILFLRSMSKQNELIIILSSGIPIWKVFIIPIGTIFLIGVLILAIINPIGTYGLVNYEKLEAKITGTPHLNFVILRSGIFFFEKFVGNNRIIQAKSINPSQQTLSDVTILLVDSHNNLTKRIDAATAKLTPRAFKLTTVVITDRSSSEKLDQLELPTNLSIDNLMQRFIPPEMIPIFQLRDSIEKFAVSGLAVTKYQLYYYKQLFKPLTMVAMSFIACWFISLNMRDTSNAQMAVLGLALGMCTYFFLEITLRILSHSGLHPALATFLPILFIILISNFVILHFQEA